MDAEDLAAEIRRETGTPAPGIRRQVHLPFHGVTAADVATILARVNRGHGQGVS